MCGENEEIIPVYVMSVDWSGGWLMVEKPEELLEELKNVFDPEDKSEQSITIKQKRVPRSELENLPEFEGW